MNQSRQWHMGAGSGLTLRGPCPWGVTGPSCRGSGPCQGWGTRAVRGLGGPEMGQRRATPSRAGLSWHRPPLWPFVPQCCCQPSDPTSSLIWHPLGRNMAAFMVKWQWGWAAACHRLHSSVGRTWLLTNPSTAAQAHGLHGNHGAFPTKT